MRNLAFAAPAVVALVLALSGCGSSSSNSSLGGTTTPGTVAISSNPSGARIAIDGRDTGKSTPATLPLSADSGLGSEYVVTLTLPGYNTWGGIASVTGDDSTTMQAALTPAGGGSGTLTTQSDPAGARVSIDGVDTGKVTPSLLSDVPAGQHVVQFDLSGSHSYREQVVVAAGESVTSAPTLTREGNGRVTGRVVDSEGQGLVGAQVTVQGLPVSTQTTAYGIFVLPNVPAGNQTLGASLASGSQSLIGVRDNVKVVDGHTTSNADVVTSLGGNGGSLVGRVLDSRGQPIEGAVLFASQAVVPNFVPDASLSPRTVETDAAGSYQFSWLPSGYWVVTAAYPGLAMVTEGVSPQIFVSDGATTRADFTLPSSGVGQPLPPTQLDAVAFTMPLTTSRAPAAYQGLRDRILASRPASRGRQTQPIPTRNRTAAPGSLIEVDLSWRGSDSADVIGYFIGRSEQPDSGFALIEDLLNPHAGLWLDYDQRLAPGRGFYYRVTAVNSQGIHSDPSGVAHAQPLDQVTVASPMQTATSAAPTFTWNTLPGAFAYGVELFSSFPDRSTAPLWTSDWVYAPENSVLYSGPDLQSGHTYYWAVIGMNSATPALANGYSISQITPFAIP